MTLPYHIPNKYFFKGFFIGKMNFLTIRNDILKLCGIIFRIVRHAVFYCTL